MKIRVFGGQRKFINLLKSLCEVREFSDVEEALEGADDIDALFILPKYDKKEYSIPELSSEAAEKLSRLIKERKTKIYIENYPAYDYRDCFVLGLQARSLISNVGRYTLCLSGGYKDSLGFEILQKRGGYYFPAAIHTDAKTEILMEIKSCIGTHNAISAGEREGVALLKTDRGVYSSMVDLTNLSDYGIFSYGHWREFYKTLLSELIGADKEDIERAFSREYKRIEISREKREKDKKKALEEGVRRAAEWHRRSGIMKEGGGVYEMFRSFDLNIAKNLRGDSSMFTSALFMAVGKYFKDSEYIEEATRLADLMLTEKGLQIKEGENKGVFKWFSGGAGLGTHSVYVSDSSRVANSVFALYRLTGDECYGEVIRDFGEALLKWFGGEALLPACAFNYEKENLTSIQKSKRRACPEFYDAPMIFLGNIYSVTKDERYKEQIIKTASHLAKLYPNYETVTSHSDNFTNSRLLGALSVAQRFGDGVWTPVIDKLLGYFSARRHSAGGFSDGRAYYDGESLKRDMEFAVGLGGDDHIADMVYCQNTLAYTLNILLSAGGGYDRATAEEMRDSLVEFLLDTQIDSDDPRFSGVWMRAFDMDNMEYYGCDKDFAWGPYCILTGWVTGAIPLVFLELLGLKTMYSGA